MLFSSLIFLFAFLPICLGLYYLTPRKFRNGVLLLMSILFYAWGGVSYTIILVLSILINFLLVRLMSRSQTKKRTWLVTGLTFNVLVILIFKYLDFFIDNINGLGELFSPQFAPLPLYNIVLPLGISFFTFQQMSLLWDVYRDPKTERASLTNTALYISLFPQLIAGPIVRYNDIIAQIKGRRETVDLFRSGIQRFVLGLFKKIIIANGCGSLADEIMGSGAFYYDTSTAWLGVVAYALQIYFDFAGYSDMAIGLGRMFGFRILENFNFPYIAKNMKDFWQRWHISLSSWFRDYVYIPLGGNRKGLNRMYVNLFTVFLLTGFWHGATWSFVVWGMFHGSFLVIEKVGFDKVLNRLPAFVGWAYTMLVVLLAWVFFRIENLGEAVDYIVKLFGGKDSGPVTLITYLNNERIFVLILALLASSTFFVWSKKQIEKVLKPGRTFHSLLADIGVLALFLYSVLFIISDSYNPFIYFRF